MKKSATYPYRNAKKTLFNPIRSEMVKYQMKVITEFIDTHTAKGSNFENAIDYSSLLKLNYEADYLFDILTDEVKFSTHEFDEIDAERSTYCRENLGGLFEISKRNNELHPEPVYGDFNITKQYIQTKYIKEKERNNQDLYLQRFYLSKKFLNFYTDLLNLQTNPFIPKEINRDITLIIDNIYKNIATLYDLLSMHISKQTDTTYHKVYSEFLVRKIDHQNDLLTLRNNISIYFKVNKV